MAQRRLDARRRAERCARPTHGTVRLEMQQLRFSDPWHERDRAVAVDAGHQEPLVGHVGERSSPTAASARRA